VADGGMVGEVLTGWLDQQFQEDATGQMLFDGV
jgi:hypothetical protein